MSQNSDQVAAPTPKCTCWIGRGAEGGWAPDRIACAVHGDEAIGWSRVAAPTPETPSPLSRREAEQLALAYGTKTDRELATLLPTLSVEARIVVVLAKFVGGAVSRHYDGENNAKVAESRVAVDLFQRLKPWLAGAVSHPQPDPKTTNDDEVARVDGRGLSAGFGTAGSDAGPQ